MAKHCIFALNFSRLTVAPKEGNPVYDECNFITHLFSHLAVPIAYSRINTKFGVKSINVKPQSSSQQVFHACHMPSSGVNFLISLDDILLLFCKILVLAYSLILYSVYIPSHPCFPTRQVFAAVATLTFLCPFLSLPQTSLATDPKVLHSVSGLQGMELSENKL